MDCEIFIIRRTNYNDLLLNSFTSKLSPKKQRKEIGSVFIFGHFKMSFFTFLLLKFNYILSFNIATVIKTINTKNIYCIKN